MRRASGTCVRERKCSPSGGRAAGSFGPSSARTAAVCSLPGPQGTPSLPCLGGAEVRGWDVVTGKEAFPPFTLPPSVFWMGFGPDGRRLLTLSKATLDLDQHGRATSAAAGDFEGGEKVREARVWDLATGKPLTPVFKDLTDAELSADGKRLLTRSPSEVRVRDAATGQPLTSALMHDWPLVGAGLSPDG